jgi:hypothetical protein
MSNKKRALLNLFFPHLISNLILKYTKYTKYLTLLWHKIGQFNTILRIDEHESKCPLSIALGSQFAVVKYTDMEDMILGTDALVDDSIDSELIMASEKKINAATPALKTRKSKLYMQCPDVPLCDCQSTNLPIHAADHESILNIDWEFCERFSKDGPTEVVMAAWKMSDNITCVYVLSKKNPKLRWLVVLNTERNKIVQCITLKTFCTSLPVAEAAMKDQLLYLLISHSDNGFSSGVLHVFRIKQ